MNRLFEFPKVKEQIDQFSAKCRGCVQLRRSPQPFREMRNFDSETKEIKRIGQRILADEMHRTVDKPMIEGKITRSNLAETSSVKLVFAPEFLTRMNYAKVITGNLTSEKLKKMLYEVRNTLAITENDDCIIAIRMDGASTHKSLVEDEDLKKAGIQIILTQKTTPTKNVLASLDSRMILNSFRVGIPIRVSLIILLYYIKL